MDSLVLVRHENGQKMDILDSLVDEGIAYSYTYDGASQTTLKVSDPDWTRLTNRFFDRNSDDRLDAIDVELDGIWWRLTGISADDGEVLTLTFEERNVQRLRAKFGHVQVSRNKSTRAQFVRRLVKSIRNGSIGFYSRELADKQPIAKSDSAAGSSSNPDSKDTGISKSSGIKIKGVAADTDQISSINIALTQAREDNATKKVLKALLVAGIGESDFRKSNNTGGHVGVWQSNQIPANEVALQAHHFLVGGRSFRAGGAIQAVKDHPDWTVGKVASAVEISDADGAFYDKYGDEADAIISAGGGDLPDSPAAPASYQYSVAKAEDYWDASRRLADEVAWRFFSHRGTFYFMDDYQLLRGTVQHTFKCQNGSEFVGKPTFEWDHRGSYPHEMTLSVILPRNYLAPGDVVNVTEAGPLNGRWIVGEIAGTWYDSVINLTLHMPQAPKKEPAHTDGQTAGSDSGSGGDKIDGAIAGSPVPGQEVSPPDHQTGGLAGYPAFDYMAAAGTKVVSPVDGKVFKLSGKSPSLGGPPGGPLGYSIYIDGSNGKKYFLTHVDKVKVKVGQSVSQGEWIAEIANGPSSWSSPHVHMGVNG